MMNSAAIIKRISIFSLNFLAGSKTNGPVAPCCDYTVAPKVSYSTIRGLRENRVLAEGMAWANTELRIKLVKFTVAKQYFYIAVNPFFDAGIITRPYKADALAAIADADGKIYDPAFDLLTGSHTPIYDASKVDYLVYSGGAGLKIAMNQNFIISAEFAKCFVSDLSADPWIGIGINYQF